MVKQVGREQGGRASLAEEQSPATPERLPQESPATSVLALDAVLQRTEAGLCPLERWRCLSPVTATATEAAGSTTWGHPD